MNLPSRTACPTLSSSGIPLPGSQPSLNQKTYRNTRPSQNTGADTPMSAKIMAPRSSHVRRLMAEMMPIGMPIESHTMAAPNASVSVTGNRLLISSHTGTWLP